MITLIYDAECPICQHEFDTKEWSGHCEKCGNGYYVDEEFLSDYSDSWYSIYWDKYTTDETQKH